MVRRNSELGWEGDGIGERVAREVGWEEIPEKRGSVAWLSSCSQNRGRDGSLMISCARATRGLRRMGREQPGALVARRTRTVKLCSSDARSLGQPRPLPLKRCGENEKGLPRRAQSDHRGHHSLSTVRSHKCCNLHGFDLTQYLAKSSLYRFLVSEGRMSLVQFLKPRLPYY